MHLRHALIVLLLLVAQGIPTASGAPKAVTLRALLASVTEGAAAAVRDGDPVEMTRWATRYEHGEGVRKNIDVAIALYCMAAVDDNRDAAYGLGWIYANGRGVARDDGLAAGWLSRAARDGDRYATRLLERLGPAPTGTREECLLSDGQPLQLPIRAVPNPKRAEVVKWVRQLAPAAGIDPALALAMIEVESAFNANARSPKDASGLMQLLPSTAKRFGVANIWDPLSNVRGGLAYLKWLNNRFDGKEKLILAGYNAGENAVQRYKGIPPYKETQGYVKRVLKICRRARAGIWRFELGPKARKRVSKSGTIAGPGFPAAKGLVTCG